MIYLKTYEYYFNDGTDVIFFMNVKTNDLKIAYQLLLDYYKTSMSTGYMKMVRNYQGIKNLDGSDRHWFIRYDISQDLLRILSNESIENEIKYCTNKPYKKVDFYDWVKDNDYMYLFDANKMGLF